MKDKKLDNINFAKGHYFFSDYGVVFSSIDSFCNNKIVIEFFKSIKNSNKKNTLNVYYFDQQSDVRYSICYLTSLYSVKNVEIIFRKIHQNDSIFDLIADECTVYLPQKLSEPEKFTISKLQRYGIKILWTPDDIEEMLNFSQPFDPGKGKYFQKRSNDKGRLWYSIIEVQPDFVDRVKVSYGSKLYNAYISHCGSAKINMGHGSYISESPRFFLDGEFNLGNYCQISTDFTAITRRHAITDLSLGHISGGGMGFFGEGHDQKDDISIGSDVWIGTKVTVLPGVNIGHGCVIGANSVVTKNCEPYGIYAGNPAKFIRFRFNKDKIKALLETKWWDWPLDKIWKNNEYFKMKVEDLSVEQIKNYLK
jgi:acetyltransferase-like isoleucine patch superfamily enzyme